MLTLDQISAAPDLPTETINVPEWGGDVKLRTLTAAERDSWEAAVLKRHGDDGDFDFDNMPAELVARCLINDDGTPMFPNLPSGVQMLAKKSSPVVYRLYEVAQRMNGLRKKDIEELEKNSAAAQSGSSCSTLPTAGVAA